MRPTRKEGKEIPENDFLDTLVSMGASITILFGLFILITIVSLLI